MPNRCDCCGCQLVDDYGTSTVSGTGSADDPFMVTRVDPSFVRPAVRVTRLGALASVPNNTPTAVPFTAEVFDTDTMWDGADPTRIVFNERGLFSFGAEFQWGGAGRRGGFWSYTPANGSGTVTLIDKDVAGTTLGLLRVQLNYQWFFEIGDYIELFVVQSSGGSLNLTSALAWAVYHGRKV